MPGLSFREFLVMNRILDVKSVSLDQILNAPNAFCREVKKNCQPLEHFSRYLKEGYYPFYFENQTIYQSLVESVVNYTIDTELTRFRGIEMGSCRKVKALLKVISQMVPYEVDISKLSKNIGIQRPTTLKYLKNLEEAALIQRLFTDVDSISDLQKPDKILLDNSNLLYTLADTAPEIGTVRETFFCNQLVSAGHKVEYGGLKSGDFRIDNNVIIEVGGRDKGFKQIADEENAYVAADDIDSATTHKIPLWAFGFLY
jgi:predicted AAA+ superfamily ATPase